MAVGVRPETNEQEKFTMTNANGFNERVLVGLETSFKTPPGTPAGYKLPVSNPSFKPTVQRFTSEALTGSAQPRKPVDGKVSVQGSFDLECNTGSLGPVLSGLMGSEAVQGTGSYRDHVIYLGTPQSWYAEQQFGDINQFLVTKGNRFDKGDFTFDPEGLMKATISMRGALTAILGSAFTGSGHITDKTVDPPLSYLFSAIKYGGSAVTDLQEVKLSIDRQAEDVKCIDGTNELADIITKIAMVKGSIKALFQDASLINDALSSTETSLDFYVPSSVLGYGLWVTLPTLLLMPTGPTTNGPGGLVTQEFTYDAYGATANSHTKAFSASKAFTTVTVTSSSTDALTISIDGASDIPVTLTAGTRTPAQIATDINSAITTEGTAFVRNGRVWVESATGGSTSSVEFKTVTHDGAANLGFAEAKYSGADQQAIRFVVTNADTAVYNA